MNREELISRSFCAPGSRCSALLACRARPSSLRVKPMHTLMRPNSRSLAVAAVAISIPRGCAAR